MGSQDLSDAATLRDLDKFGIDAQLLFPSALYACMGADPFFEAAMFRAYNLTPKTNSRRLKWAALLPLRDVGEGIAIQEMQGVGVCRRSVRHRRDRLLSHKSFTPVWDELAHRTAALCAWGEAIRRSIIWQNPTGSPCDRHGHAGAIGFRRRWPKACSTVANLK
jgi:hypothetical protein